MKKISIIIALFVGASLISFAQQGPGLGPQGKKRQWQGKIDSLSPEKIAQSMTDRMANDLSLTNEQKAKVYEINLKTATEQKALREAMQKQQQEHQAKMKANHDARIKAIEKVLTPEQNATWKQNREEHQQQMQERKEQFQKKRWDR